MLERLLGIAATSSENRRFARLTGKLIRNGIIEYVLIVNSETSRRYLGVKLLKDLPKGHTLSAMLKNADDDDDDNASMDQEFATLITNDNTAEGITYNTYFPLHVQVRDYVKSFPSVSRTDMEKAVTGTKDSKAVANVMEMMATTKYDGSSSNIMKLPAMVGKFRFSKLVTMKSYAEISGKEYTENKLPVPTEGDSKNSIIQYSSDVFSRGAFTRRLYSIEFSGNRSILWFFKLRHNVTLSSMVPRSAEISKYISIDGTYEVLAQKNKIISIKERPKLVANSAFDEPSRETSLELSAPNFEELQHLTAASEQVLGQEEPIQIGQIVRDINSSEKDKNSDEGNNSALGDMSLENITITQVDLDYGPTKRREALVELVNEERCVVVNVALQSILSERIKVNYTVDRKTIKSDARKVAEKGLVTLGTFCPY
ncbi:unnamed protein product [Ambrosiozyma monospora]|uniref:Unnamed protein product n=1 Tax=Ambrosiozyma monospora TaxID=43982 RepID=A0ACB5TE66_AMBMO|nr:unnamed protein product [Ambrosiozyma monospora]